MARWGRGVVAGFGAFLDLLFPRICPLCEERVSGESGPLHAACLKELPTIAPPACASCGAALGAGTVAFDDCPECYGRHYSFAKAFAALQYHKGGNRLILALKVGKDVSLAPLCGRLLAERLKGEPEALAAHLVIPLPLTPFKRALRGFNQAELIAAECAKQLQIPLGLDILLRTGERNDQAALKHWSERQENVRDLFRVARPDRIADKTILLVDDILTTGATLSEAARVLKKSGAKKIYVATLCR